ncbi:transposase, partial [Salmonella enterica subsp. enterica serovar Teshie]|nr:transposase [Salmonella enterica subsp. enterica serovar Teshie]
MEFKLAMVEKSLQPDVSVALLARNNGINDNLLLSGKPTANILSCTSAAQV